MRSGEDRIFSEALALEGEQQRQKYLDRECADDPELKNRILSLLESYEEAGFLDEVPNQIVSLIQSGSVDNLINKMAGPYRLLEAIGSGGMGIVFLAESVAEPNSARVAVKILRLGLDSAPVLSRFRLEQRTLECLEHPNIAKYIGGGITEFDRPYFAMEWVDGLSLIHYCERFQPAFEERLRLFLELCRAIQYAHEQGIVHRDLKPSNLLVVRSDTTAIAKVIDFGIAKAMMADFDSTLPNTRAYCVLGTPDYMSPEQMQWSSDIDRRTDIYSMGIVLFELLVGVTPREYARRVREQGQEVDDSRAFDVLKPSEVYSTIERIAQLRKGLCLDADGRKPEKWLRGLDWVVLKATVGSRADRYSHMSEFVEDVEALLENRKPSAGPPSFSTQLLQWYESQRALVSLLSIAATLGLLMWVASGWFLVGKGPYLPRGSSNDPASSESLTSEAVMEASSKSAHARFVQDLMDAQQLLTTAKMDDCADMLEEWQESNSPYRDHFVLSHFDRFLHARKAKYSDGHQANILDARLAPKGQWLVSVDRIGDIIVRERATGRIIEKLHPSDDEVTRICFSPDGQRFATSGTSKRVQVWSTDDFSSEHVFMGHLRTVTGLSWSPDGKTLASGDREGILKVWDVEDQQLLRTLNVDAGEPLRALRFSPDGLKLAVACGSGPIRILSTSDWTVTSEFDVQRPTVLAVDFTPDGNSILFAGYNSLNVYLANLQTRIVQSISVVTGQISAVRCLDDRHFLAGTTTGQLACIIQRPNGLVISRRETVSPDAWIRAIEIFPDDDKLYIAADESRSLHEYALSDWMGYQKSQYLPLRISSRDPSDLWYHWGNQSSSIVRDGREILSVPGVIACTTPRYREKSRTVLIAPRTSEQTGCINILEVDGNVADGGKLTFPFDVAKFDISPDERYVVATAYWGNAQILVWDIDNKQSHEIPLGTPPPNNAIAVFSNDGKRLAVAVAGTNRLHCFRPGTWDLERTIETVTEIGAVVQSPSGQWIVGESDGISAWSSDLTEQLWSIRYPANMDESRVADLAISPDESLIASYHSDGDVRFYDVQSRRLLATQHMAKLGLQRMLFEDSRTLRIDADSGTYLFGARREIAEAVDK